MKCLTTLIISFILFFSTLTFSQDTIKVRPGWNIIGAISTQTLSHIKTEPTGIITSYYFAYSPTGYSAMHNLHKGEGY